ncbi:unnamed protein product [Anisakis simplex]|uniref:Ig-like domain-containing protein n=1 Tax=Anisakis simplex TaxID=6269 RepID=A0A0M3K3Q0_ANISI|nr:unnamed protein product [Anisakis simplex]
MRLLLTFAVSIAFLHGGMFVRNVLSYLPPLLPSSFASPMVPDKNSTLRCKGGPQQSSTNFYCWYAFEIGTQKFELLNGTKDDGQVITRNIAPYCSGKRKAREHCSFNGFSFGARTIPNRYIDDWDGKNLSRPMVLYDVFYMCCWSIKACKHMLKKSENAIILQLQLNAMEHLPKLPHEWINHGRPSLRCLTPDGTLMGYIKGVHTCFFMLEKNSNVTIYSGPLLFNRIDQRYQTAHRHSIHLILACNECHFNKAASESFAELEKNSLARLASQQKLCATKGSMRKETELRDGECWQYVSMYDYALYCCCYPDKHSTYSHCAFSSSVKQLYYPAVNIPIWQDKAHLHSAVIVKNGKPLERETVYEKDWSNTDLLHDWIYRDFIYSRPDGNLSSETLAQTRLWHCAHGKLILQAKSGRVTSQLTRVFRTSLPDRSSHCLNVVSVDFNDGMMKASTQFMPACSNYIYSYQMQVFSMLPPKDLWCFTFFQLSSRKPISIMFDINAFTADRNISYVPMKLSDCGHTLQVVHEAIYCVCRKDRSQTKQFCEKNLKPTAAMKQRRKCFVGAQRKSDHFLFNNTSAGEVLVDDVPLCYMLIHLQNNKFSFKLGAVDAEYSAILSRFHLQHRRMQFFRSDHGYALINVCKASSEGCNSESELGSLKRLLASKHQKSLKRTRKACRTSLYSETECTNHAGCFMYRNYYNNSLNIMGCMDRIESLAVSNPFYAGLKLCSRVRLFNSESQYECYGVESMNGTLCCCLNNCPDEVLEKFRTAGYSPARAR